ncbi:MAG TPA: adenylyl-sulfate kinase [Casimicrobiaceae bacterium]|nr:adenylyl-sulfate kinase [Casimicrobiaceae bacterium]
MDEKPTDHANITWQPSRVTSAERERLFAHEAVTLWLTGLSAAGKSTLAFEVERRLITAGHAAVVLDGDNLRHGLSRDLGFGPNARHENLRRVAEVAKLMNGAGLIVLSAFISPYRDDRSMARDIIGAGRFCEVHVAASLEACEARDPKGLYRRARRGEIAEFTGISAPYEAPEHPALTLDTEADGVDACAVQLMRLMAPYLGSRRAEAQ